MLNTDCSEMHEIDCLLACFEAGNNLLSAVIMLDLSTKCTLC